MLIDLPRTRQLRPSTAWVSSRRYPLLATVALLLVGMLTTTLGVDLIGQAQWSLPHDLWRTMVAGDRLRHLDFAHLYTPPTALITFPGAALILVPVVLVIDATGLGLAFQNAHNPHPNTWWVAGPYEIVISATVLFASDRIATRLGATARTRAVLAGAGALALWSVSIRWGHPEDAVALALLLYGILALSNGSPIRSAWLVGCAVAVQPLVLLAVPLVLAVVQGRRLLGFLLRAAAPATVLLGAAAVANWTDTLRAVTSQPNWPVHNHSTPFTALAPQLVGGGVAAGPWRALSVLLACGCAAALAWRWRHRNAVILWSPSVLAQFLWWVAVALAFRCVFETVMIAYYLWPVLAVALVAASRSRTRIVSTAVAVCVITAAAEIPEPGPWIWWSAMVIALAFTLAAAWPGGADDG